MNLDRRLLHQARRGQLALLLTILFGFAAGVVTVLQARLLSQVVNGVFLFGYGFDAVSSTVFVLAGVILLRAGFVFSGEIASGSIALQVKVALRRQLTQRLFSLGPGYTNNERTGELTSVLLEGVEALDAYYSQYLPQLVLAAIVPLTFLFFIFPLDWISGLVLVLTAPLIPIFMILIGDLAQALTRRQWKMFSRMNAYFLDVLQGLTTLKIFSRSQPQVKVIEQVSERYRRMTMSVLRVTFLSALALEMLATLSTAVVAVEVGLRLLYGQMAFEQAFFVLLLAPEFYLPLRLLGTRFHAGMSGVAAGKKIFEILEAPESRGETAHNVQSKAEQDRRSFGNCVSPSPFTQIVFEDVKVSYTEDVPALKGVSLTVQAGQRIAMVGPTGSGKSTVASLLLGFIQPDQGGIWVDGHPLPEIPVSAWRLGLAWVPQKPHLFNDTIAANIRLGLPEAGMDQVEQAARRAYAHEFIMSFPEGYETRIGEAGTRLSAGQAQRLALARAFLKDAPFLILDEATSNLDLHSEYQVQQALQELLVGRTAFVIAHRLSTIMSADLVIVLEEGKVVACGSPAELAGQEGLFQRMLRENQISAGDLPLQQTKDSSLSAPVESDQSPVTDHTSKHQHPILRLLNLVAPYKGRVALSVFLSFSTIASSIGLMSTSAYLISAAALQPSIADLQVAIVGVRFFGIARGVFRYLERYVSHEVTFRVLGRLRVSFYRALEPLAPARLAGYHSGDLLTRISGDIESLENFYVRALAPTLTVLPVAGLVMILLINWAGWLVALAWLFFLLLAGVAVPVLGRGVSRSHAAEAVRQRAGLSVALVDGIQGMPDLLAFSQEQRQADWIDQCSLALGKSQVYMARINGLQTGLLTLLSNLGMWSVTVLAIPLVVSGLMPGVMFAVVSLAAIAGFEAIQSLPAAAQVLDGNIQAGRRLWEIIDTPPQVSDPVTPLAVPSQFNLLVRDVCFTYPHDASLGEHSVQGTALAAHESNRPRIGFSSPHRRVNDLEDLWTEIPQTIRDFNLELPTGKHIALVGPSGSGKSTLVNILLRFWDYQGGNLLLDGRELSEYRQNDVRAHLAVVPQNAYIFSGSIRENLLLAKPTATQTELENAARLAQIHGVIQSMPQGYDTWVGEQGMRLSGGERQRLALARALLKDAPLLILDEPTAHLDTITEQQVIDGILQASQGRSLLWITHRLIAMEHMDEILVLQDGMVVERGKHHELLVQRGDYWQTWELQRMVIGLESGSDQG